MTRLIRRAPTSQAGMPRRRIRNRTDAATELVRLEYERERLILEGTTLRDRLEKSDAALTRTESRMAMLQGMLSVEQPEPVAAPTPPPAPFILPPSMTGRSHANARNRR